MPNYIISYQKVINQSITIQPELPDAAVELISVGSTTYASIPAATKLEDIKNASSLGAAVVQITDEIQDLLADSPHVELINNRVLRKIAKKYSITDEIKLLRTAPSDRFNEYNAYAEECRSWGYAQKLALGVINDNK